MFIITCGGICAFCSEPIVNACYFFAKKMRGKEVHCTFFYANLRANVCAVLGYEFYNDIYAEYVDVVSFITPKWLGAAAVRA